VRIAFALVLAVQLSGVAAAEIEPASRIPLVAGLTVTTAIAEAQGDYESLKRLARRSDAGWRLLYSTELPASDGRLQRFDSERLLHDADLQRARSYRSRFEANTEEDYPGTTALGTSAAVIDDLRGSGSSRYSLVGEDRFMANALVSFPGAQGSVLELAASLMASNGVSYRGELVKQSSAQLDVLVNGVVHALPVLIASGRFTARNGQQFDAELAFLDDRDNPLALQWRIGNSTLRAVRIDYPLPNNALASALQTQQRVVLPGLYFDFGSAELRPESAVSLPAIIEAILAAPSGVLTLAGHTDAIGDAPRNQALSQARAEAVRAALVGLDASLAERLSAAGYGATQPVASNSTLEGRARNRRVELVLP